MASLATTLSNTHNKLRTEVPKILTAHHVVNIILTTSFYLSKVVTPLCELVFRGSVKCHIEQREHEILLFLVMAIFWKNRKSTNWLHYLANVFIFAKIANAGLFFRLDPMIGIIFAAICIMVAILLPEPAYAGPEKVVYFQRNQLSKELEADKSVTWVIEFYTNWSPECKRLVPVFAQLSEKFNLPNLKFGKVDIGRSKEEAERFCINDHPTSRQLPTIALFVAGEEKCRRPVVRTSRAIPFVFSEANILTDFDLSTVHESCKKKLSKEQKAELEKEQTDARKNK